MDAPLTIMTPTPPCTSTPPPTPLSKWHSLSPSAITLYHNLRAQMHAHAHAQNERRLNHHQRHLLKNNKAGRREEAAHPPGYRLAVVAQLLHINTHRRTACVCVLEDDEVSLKRNGFHRPRRALGSTNLRSPLFFSPPLLSSSPLT